MESGCGTIVIGGSSNCLIVVLVLCIDLLKTLAKIQSASMWLIVRHCRGELQVGFLMPQ